MGIMLKIVMVVNVGWISGNIRWKKIVYLLRLFMWVVFFRLFDIWCMNFVRMNIVNGSFCVV